MGWQGGFQLCGEKETCISHGSNSGPSAGLNLQGSPPPPTPNLWRKHRSLSTHTDRHPRQLLPSDRREPEARDGNKAAAGSCLPGFTLYHQGAGSTAGPQGIYAVRSLGCSAGQHPCVSNDLDAQESVIFLSSTGAPMWSRASPI